jgi:hypothetical protein
VRVGSMGTAVTHPLCRTIPENGTWSRACVAIGTILCIAALIILTGLAALPARAQVLQCLPLDQAIAALATRYGEGPRIRAMMGGDDMLVITASPAGTWTALIVEPDGKACMVASGEAFGVLDAEPPGTDM